MAAPLELQPVAGLANRLRAMASAFCAAEEVGRPLTISWIQQHSISRGGPARIFNLAATPLKIRDDGFGGPPPYPYKECLTPEHWERAKDRDPYKPLYIKSYGIFWQKDWTRWALALRSIRFSQEVEEIAAGAHTFGPPVMIGVHIRRTDNRKSIAESPTELFIEEMSRYAVNTHFFLATDDATERAALAAAFPYRVRWLNHSLNRDSEEGGVAAAADFLALSRCTAIIGSAGSSFSEIAALYGNCPLITVRRQPMEDLSL